jgi:ribosome biogenesis protein MAK21
MARFRKEKGGSNPTPLPKNRSAVTKKHHAQQSVTKSGRRTNDTEASMQNSESQLASTVPVVLGTKVSSIPKNRLIVQPIAQWYTSIPHLDPASPSSPAITPTQLSALTSRISALHATDIQTFQTSSSNSSSSEANFFSKIIQSGTLSDRLSALTLLVQSSPLHNTKALENLKGMAERGKGKGGREESLKALRCVVDWWVGGGAPGRKLK